MLLLQPSPFHSTMQRSKTGCAPWGFNARGHLTQQDPKKIIGSAQGELKIVKVRCFSWTPVRLHHMKWILHGYQSYQWFQWPMIYYFILYQQIHMYWPGLSQVSTYRRRPVLPTKCQKKNGAIVSCRSLIFNDRWCAYVTACSIYIYICIWNWTTRNNNLGSFQFGVCSWTFFVFQGWVQPVQHDIIAGSCPIMKTGLTKFRTCRWLWNISIGGQHFCRVD